MLVEGRNAVEEALRGHSTIEKILILRDIRAQDIIDKIKRSGVQYQFCDRAMLDRVSKTKNHQGFIAFVSEFIYCDVMDMIRNAYKKGRQPLVVLLDGVEDPHNLGNIMRTAECMGVDGIIIPKNRAVAVNETVVRVSAGASAHVSISRVTNINQEIERLKKEGFWIYACEVGGGNIDQTNLQGPLAIVVGGEHTGVSHLARSLCDGTVSIPMHGKLNSLNVATATAIALYEVNRQRNIK